MHCSASNARMERRKAAEGLELIIEYSCSCELKTETGRVQNVKLRAYEAVQLIKLFTS